MKKGASLLFIRAHIVDHIVSFQNTATSYDGSVLRFIGLPMVKDWKVACLPGVSKDPAANQVKTENVASATHCEGDFKSFDPKGSPYLIATVRKLTEFLGASWIYCLSSNGICELCEELGWKVEVGH